jgi:hypothetical protein
MITSDTTQIGFQIDTPGKSVPTLNMLRIGSASKNRVTMPFINKTGNKYNFAVDTSKLKSGRYYAAVSFAGVCCYRTEIDVAGCNYDSLKVTTNGSASGCATC